MATYYKAKTETIDGTPFFQLDTLHERDVPKCRINMEIFNTLPPYRKETILPSTYMHSRGAWAMEMLSRICRLAKIDGLPFLIGTRVPGVRIISIVADGDSGKTYIENYGFLLDEPAMNNANEAIDRLFDWSAANIDTLADEDLMGFYTSGDGVREAIQTPIISDYLTASSESGSRIAGSEDGDGPWYFYSWLRSVQQVIKTALLFQQHVLHTTKIFG